MTKDEIIDLIKACSEYGVGSLELGELKLTLSHWPKWGVDLAKTDLQSGTGVEVDSEDEARVRDQQASELLITDPVQFEAMMEKGEM